MFSSGMTSFCYERGFILFTFGSGGGLCLGDQLPTALMHAFSSALPTSILPQLLHQLCGQLEGLLEDVGIVSSKRAFIKFNVISDSNHTSQISQISKQNKTEWVSREDRSTIACRSFTHRKLMSNTRKKNFIIRSSFLISWSHQNSARNSPLEVLILSHI